MKKREDYDDIVFGIHAVSELVENRRDQVDHIFFAREVKSAALFTLLKVCRKKRLAYQQVPLSRLDYMTGHQNHQGVAAQCPVKNYSPVETVIETFTHAGDKGLLLLPASIEDPRNLGAIVRSCAGFSVDAVILEQRNTAPLSHAVAKSAAGMLEQVPVCRPKNLEGVVASLKEKGALIVGAEAHGDCMLTEVDFCQPTMIIVGGEHRGIPPYLKKQCTQLCRIPIAPEVNSLNVSVAASILLYECRRQRG